MNRIDQLLERCSSSSVVGSGPSADPDFERMMEVRV